MCGISGIVRFGTLSSPCASLIQRMTDAMSHRGPNGEGHFVDPGVCLGHRRLSIIDVEGGAQPIYNEDSSVVTVFNGEIYNYRDLTARLEAAGHTFRTHSDTETIVHAYEEYGARCVEQFRGMFAFALWDRRARKLLLARDRLGIKPLYYFYGPNFFAFGSEIKALLEIPEIPRTVDTDSLSSYLSLRYVPGPRTMFRQIYKLQPGHILTLEGQSVSVRKFWDVEFQPRDDDPNVLLEGLDRELSESVRYRLLSEVPLGVFLSGGLDSTAILAMLGRLRSAAGINTFSVGYTERSRHEREANEFRYAAMAAKAFGAQHHECRIGPDDVNDVLPEIAWHLDEPLADPTCVPLYFLSKAARGEITVALSGEGSDEIFGGYGIYPRMLHAERAQRRYGPVLAGAAALLGPLVESDRYQAAIEMVTRPLDACYRGVSRAFHPSLKRQLIAPDAAGTIDRALDALFEAHFRKTADSVPLNRMLYVDAHVWLPDDLLLKADKMTMAHGLELRVPFLDHHMVEFAAGLPPEHKLRGRVGKVLLRKLMAGRVPAAILRREKKGFPIPISHWLRESLRDTVHDALLAPSAAVRDYMDAGVIRRVVHEHERGEVDREKEIWTLLMFEYWHRVFLNPASARRGNAALAAVEV